MKITRRLDFRVSVRLERASKGEAVLTFRGYDGQVIREDVLLTEGVEAVISMNPVEWEVRMDGNYWREVP